MWAFLNPNVPENCVIDSSAIQIFYEKHRLASGTARKPVFVGKYDWSLFWNIKERNFNWAHGHLNALPRNKIKAVTIQRKTKLENENHAEKFNPLRDVAFQGGMKACSMIARSCFENPFFGGFCLCTNSSTVCGLERQSSYHCGGGFWMKSLTAKQHSDCARSLLVLSFVMQGFPLCLPLCASSLLQTHTSSRAVTTSIFLCYFSYTDTNFQMCQLESIPEFISFNIGTKEKVFFFSFSSLFFFPVRRHLQWCQCESWRRCIFIHRVLYWRNKHNIQSREEL